MSSPSTPAQTPLRFSFDRRPLDEAERAVFAPDLEALGLDRRVLDVLDGLVSTRTRDDIPHVLRGFRGQALVFVAHAIVCRRMMRTFFPNRVGAFLDTIPSPTITWTRHDPGVDLCGSPGFAADGEDREALVHEAIAFLTRRYLSVSVLEEESTPRQGRFVEIGMADSGRYVAGRGGVEGLFERRTHLRRKVAKFRNKGGTVQVVEGALSADDRAGVLHCIRCAQGARLLHVPYQGNYTNMVDWATTAGTPGLVHIIARLEGAFVGYHAFVESGRQLLCLSGGFDRSRHTTYHAYENVLLEAMQYAEARGLDRVLFGPVTNPSKAAVMTDAARMAVRVHSRWPPVLRMIEFILPRSAMRPENLAPYRGLAAVAAGETG